MDPLLLPLPFSGQVAQIDCILIFRDTSEIRLLHNTLLIPVFRVCCLVWVFFWKGALTLQISKSKFPAAVALLSCTVSLFIRYVIVLHFFCVSRRALPRLKAKPSPMRGPRRTCPGRVSATCCAQSTATASTCTATDPGQANTSAPSTRGRLRSAPGSAHKTGWSR